MTDDDDPRQEADGFLGQILADTSRDPYYRKTRVPAAAACPAAGVEAGETGDADEGGIPASDGRPASERWAFVREGRDVQDFYQQTARPARPRVDQVADGRRARQALADLIAQDVTPTGGATSGVKRRPEAPGLLQALMAAVEPGVRKARRAAGRLRGRWAARPKGPAGGQAGAPMRPAGARFPEDPPHPSRPAEPSEASSAAGDVPPSATRKARRWGVILAAGLLLVNGVTAGLGLLHHRALADCQEGQGTLISQRENWRAARRRARHLPVWRVTVAQVEEPGTVLAFHSAANQDTPNVMDCPTHAPASSLFQRAKTNRRSTAWLKKQETILTDRASLVERSRQAKLTANAAGAVRRLVGEAKSLYASSQGKVADEATRSGLRDAIRAAGKPAATLSAYRRREGDLTAAMGKVSQSMKDKQEADRKAAQPQPAPAPAPSSPPAPAPAHVPVRPAPPAIRRPAPRPSRPTVPPAPAPAPSTPSGEVGVNVG